MTFFQNVIMPGISLLPSCQSYFWSEREVFLQSKFDDSEVFPRGYSIIKPNGVPEYLARELVVAKIRGDRVGKFKAPKYIIDHVKNFYDNNYANKKIITITVRELTRGDPSGVRKIDKAVWENVSEELSKDNCQLLLIRDTHNAFEKKRLIKNIPELPIASIHLLYRAGVYQTSAVNCIKNNGPGIILLFSNSKSIYIHEFDNDFLPTSELFFKNNYGMKFGSHFPMTTENINFQWGREKFENISESIKFLIKSKPNINKVHGFNDVEEIKFSYKIALNHLINCLKFNILKEDLDLIYAIDKLRKNKVIETNIMQVLSEQEGVKFKNGTVSKILSMDKQNKNILK